MSFGNGPKIYLRGAKPSILNHGGLGHRPLSMERLMCLLVFVTFELVLTHVCHPLVGFVLLVVHSHLALHMFLVIFECIGPYQCDSLNPSHSYPSTKLIYSAQEPSTLYIPALCSGAYGTTGSD